MSTSDKFRDDYSDAKAEAKDKIAKGRDVLESAQDSASDMYDSARSTARNLASQVADGARDLTETIRDQDYGDLYDQGRDFARRNPGWVIAGVAFAGFLAGRMITKPSRPRHVMVGGRKLPIRLS